MLSAVTAAIPPGIDHWCRASMPWATSMLTATPPATDARTRPNGSRPRSAAAMAADGAASRKNRGKAAQR